jgi:hypothetical protein
MIYFVTEAYLKQKTPITQNVSAIEVVKYIEPAACSWIQNILGTYFFEDLLTKYNANTLSANEIILVNKIKPAVAWRAAVDCVLGLTYQLKNKGLQHQNGENSEAVDKDTTAFVMRHYEQKAEFFESMVRRYLELNKSLFTNYTSALNTDCESALMTPQSDDNFNSDILFI